MNQAMTKFSRVMVVLAALTSSALAAPPPGPPTAAVVAAPAGPTVTLTSPGKGPVSPLRFSAKKGAKNTLTMTMKMAIAMEVGGSAVPPTATPAIKIVMGIAVTDVTATGDMTYQMKTQKVEVVPAKGVSPEVLSGTKASLAGMADLAGHATVSSRGFARDVALDVPATAPQQTRDMLNGMKQSLTQFAAPLPEEPIGIGATWDVSSVIEQNGMKLTQVAHYTLVKRTKKSATLAVTIDQQAAPQTITTNGIKLQLKAFQGSGAGESSFDLGLLVPRRATVQVHSAIEMTMPGNDGLKMKLDLDMGMTGK